MSEFPEAKALRAATKKLRDIEALKAKDQATLLPEQQAKVKNIKKVVAEVKALQDAKDAWDAAQAAAAAAPAPAPAPAKADKKKSAAAPAPAAAAPAPAAKAAPAKAPAAAAAAPAPAGKKPAGKQAAAAKPAKAAAPAAAAAKPAPTAEEVAQRAALEKKRRNLVKLLKDIDALIAEQKGGKVLIPEQVAKTRRRNATQSDIEAVDTQMRLAGFA